MDESAELMPASLIQKSRCSFPLISGRKND